MHTQYEAPELTLVGRADEVVLGTSGPVVDMTGVAAPDFEFEQD